MGKFDGLHFGCGQRVNQIRSDFDYHPGHTSPKTFLEIPFIFNYGFPEDFSC